MERINIIFSSDDNYAQFMGVSICSIFENKKCLNPIDIYILDGGVSIDNRKKLAFLAKKYQFNIEYLKINQKLFNNFKTTRHITLACYYRLIISELLPNLKKILYLDCDIVIVGDLSELFFMDIRDGFFAACDEKKYIPGRLESLKIKKTGKYFNSGVMLINLEKWREWKISEKILSYIEKNQKNFDMHDQDALNGYMHDKKWIEIPYKYNYVSWFFDIYPIKKLDEIKIIHYTGLKPWNFACLNPLRKVYFKYLNKTPWKDQRYIDKNFKNITLKIIKKILIFMLPTEIIIKLRDQRYHNLVKIKRLSLLK